MDAVSDVAESTVSVSDALETVLVLSDAGLGLEVELGRRRRLRLGLRDHKLDTCDWTMDANELVSKFERSNLP